jgi:hypothetical protein
MSESETQPTQAPPVSQPSQKLTPLVHVLCGWPLILVFFGGAIGGALGGLAYGINVAVYRSKLPVVLKAFLNPIVGVLAFILWLVIGTYIQLKFAS